MSRKDLFLLIILESLWITLLSIVLGCVFAHLLIEWLTNAYETSNQIGITGIIFLKEELWIIFTGIFIGIGTAIIPAFQAYRTDISKVLSQG